MRFIFDSYPHLNKYCCFLFLVIPLVMIGITSCSDDLLSGEDDEEPSSLLVANEGNFSDGNGSVTDYDPEAGEAVQTKFQKVNGRPLAGIIQSMNLYDNRLFIVTNNTDKIEVVDAGSLESIATITFDGDDALTPAGFALAEESKGYVTDLYNNAVAVIDLEDYALTDTRIDVGMSPMDMMVVDNQLFVANSGYGDDNTISIVDTETDEVTTTLEVGAGPAGLVAADQDRIWVISNGKKAYDDDFNRDPGNDIYGRIDVLDVPTLQVAGTVQTGGFPTAIAVNEEHGRAWVVNEETVQLIDIDNIEMIDDSFIERSFNGLGYSQSENRFYLAQSRGFTQSGQAIIYDLDGAAVDSFQVGIAPKDFVFK